MLRIYDTAARQLREFEPIVPGEVSIYLCGATVQSNPHIGHVRSSINFDILRRWLQANGSAVTFVRNVTDIDDKILAKAAAHDQPWWAWAMTHERAFDAAYRNLGLLPPTYEPRATGHVPEMVALIGRLIDRGHAYATEEGVYFSVPSFPEYGRLSGQRMDEMHSQEEQAGGKRDPRDFALWKRSRPHEPAWDTPWGPGRPGWHLECSAMATKYCGTQFDIHGGGLDLVFPHHENELAQSRAAGDGFARYWMHNSWVTAAGEKMSKSLGNSLGVDALLGEVRGVELRYYLGSAHYRSTIEFSTEALREAAAAFRRVEGFLHRAQARIGVPQAAPASWPDAFAAAMDDDLAVPAALAVLHEEVREGNTALSAGDDSALAQHRDAVSAMLEVLGVNPSAAPWSGLHSQSDDRAVRALTGLVDQLLQQRGQARAERDFAQADAIRDRLVGLGIAIEDGPQGSTWSLAEES